MAKQSVSFVERHIEKILVGLAGAIALAVFVLFVIVSPNTIELVNGETVGPGGIGPATEQLAEGVLQSIERKEPDAQPIPDYLAEARQMSPLARDTNLKPRLALAPAPFGVAPPPMKGMAPPGKVRLATIIAPGKPVVFQGRNQAKLPPPEPLPTQGGRESSRSEELVSATEPMDVTWVTVAALVDRKTQRDMFAESGYSPRFYGLYITEVRLERRKLQADGTWSEPEPVQTYHVFFPPTEPHISLVQDETGWYIDKQSGDQLEAIWKSINEDEIQQLLWRPPLAPYLDVSQWEPPPLEGINWADWLGNAGPGSEFAGAASKGGGMGGTRLSAERPERRPAPAESRRDRGRDDRTQDARAETLKLAKDEYADAQEKFANGSLDEAKQVVEKVLANAEGLPNSLVKDVKALNDRIDQAIQERQAKEQRRAEIAKLQEESGMKPEPDIEPLWAHDLTAAPGETYAYRISYVIYNRYAGRTMNLEDIQQATVPVLVSQSSAWSDPVTIEPDTYFFFTRADKNDGQATVELWKWAKGEWHRSTGKYAIGERIAGQVRPIGDLDTGRTVVDIAFDVPRTMRVEEHGRGYRVAEDQTDVLVVADDQGGVEERLLYLDRNNPELDKLKEALRRPRLGSTR